MENKSFKFNQENLDTSHNDSNDSVNNDSVDNDSLFNYLSQGSDENVGHIDKDDLLNEYLSKSSDTDSEDELMSLIQKNKNEDSNKIDDELISLILNSEGKEVKYNEIEFNATQLKERYKDLKGSELNELASYYKLKIQTLERDFGVGNTSKESSEQLNTLSQFISTLSDSYDSPLRNFLTTLQDGETVTSQNAITLVKYVRSEITQGFTRKTLKQDNLEIEIKRIISELNKVVNSKGINTISPSFIKFENCLIGIARKSFSDLKKSKIYENSRTHLNIKPYEEKIRVILDDLKSINSLLDGIEEAHIEVVTESVFRKGKEYLTLECGEILERPSVKFRTFQSMRSHADMVLDLQINFCPKCQKFVFLPLAVVDKLEELATEISKNNNINTNLSYYVPFNLLVEKEPAFYSLENMEDLRGKNISYSKDYELESFEMKIEKIFNSNRKNNIMDYKLNELCEVDTSYIKDLIRERELMESNPELMDDHFEIYKQRLDRDIMVNSIEAIRAYETSVKSLRLFKEALNLVDVQSYDKKFDIFVSNNVSNLSRENFIFLNMIIKDFRLLKENSIKVSEELIRSYPYDYKLAAKEGKKDTPFNLILTDAMFYQFCKLFMKNGNLFGKLLGLSTEKPLIVRNVNKLCEFEEKLKKSKNSSYFNSLSSDDKKRVKENIRIHNSAIDKNLFIKYKLELLNYRRLLKMIDALENNRGVLSLAVRRFRLQELEFTIKNVMGIHVDLNSHEELPLKIESALIREKEKETLYKFNTLLEQGIATGKTGNYEGNLYTYSSQDKDNNNNPLLETLREEGDFILTELRANYGNDKTAVNLNLEEGEEQFLIFEDFEYPYSFPVE